MTHAELVRLAARWLATRGAGVVITDMASGAGETPDAIGWKGRLSTLIECKASRADFRADAHKHFRRWAERAMGSWRYFLAPAGMINADDRPEGWGLLEPRGGGVRLVVEAALQHGSRCHEVELLCSALRRVIHTPGAPARGVRCKLYTIEGAGDPRATVGAADPAVA